MGGGGSRSSSPQQHHTPCAHECPQQRTGNTKQQHHTPASTTAAASQSDATLPEKRTLPPLPRGEITKPVAKARCKQICDLYPEVFDDEKGEFLGAEAVMLVKDGHMEKLMKVGVRPPAKIPYGMEEQYN